ncbi:MAG: methyltransferase domain-containing protein [Myxococcales bacterium]|nr:methyltransferase domain-containing protein [Myxococcales bacterium]
MTFRLLGTTPESSVLDVACGTGLVSRLFTGKVARLVGADITQAMFDQARPYVTELVETPGESLPFADNTFDRVVCRQGIQFMRDGEAVAEMLRVLKPGGRVVLVHLCAYGEEDRAEYFEILRLRNEARRNFYLREDLDRLLTRAGFTHVAVHDYISVEDVDVWSNTGAIEEAAREGIRAVYRDASPAFQRLHASQVLRADAAGGSPGAAMAVRIVDNMLFGLAVGEKP